ERERQAASAHAVSSKGRGAREWGGDSRRSAEGARSPWHHHFGRIFLVFRSNLSGTRPRLVTVSSTQRVSGAYLGRIVEAIRAKPLQARGPGGRSRAAEVARRAERQGHDRERRVEPARRHEHRPVGDVEVVELVHATEGV